MFRFIPVLAGTVHLLIAIALPNSSVIWDLIIYNALLLLTTCWILLKGERLLACAIGLWTLGSIYSSITDQFTSFLFELSGSWSGLGYLAFYPLLFFYILRSQQLRKLTRSQILDSLIITLGISSLLAILALSATSSAASTSEFFLLTLYPIGDLLLIFILILIGLRNGISREYFLLLSAILLFTLSDIGYLWLVSHNQYSVGGLVDEGWLVALLLCASAPKLPSSGERPFNTYPPIFIALGLSLSTLGWYALNPATISGVALAPAIATLLLAFIRMALALEEADQGKIHKELSVTDELTGIGNRREFLARLEQTPRDGTSSLLLLDLDGFKAINDEFGHGAGDGILREVAHRFRAALPDESYLARLGGDEFGVLTHRPGERTSELSGRLALALATPLYLGERAINLSVSIGTSAIDGVGNPLELADAQMYLAKRSVR